MKQCAFSKTAHISRNMSYIALELTRTFSLCTSTPSYTSARPVTTSPIVHSSEINPCHNTQQASIGYVADITPTTGHEPKDLAANDDVCVKPLFFHNKPSITSTYDSAESIATHPSESDFDDEQIRARLASPLYLQEREASADRSQVYHSVRENLVSSSFQVPKSSGKPVALLSSERKSSQETFSDREEFSSEHQQVLGNNDFLFRFSDPENSIKSSFEEHKDHMLAEAKSEVLKQECRADRVSRQFCS